MENLKNVIKPIAVITVAIITTTIIVGIIAYTNCEESRIFLDNLFGKEVITTALPQA